MYSGLTVRPDNLGGLFQPLSFCYSLKLLLGCETSQIFPFEPYHSLFHQFFFFKEQLYFSYMEIWVFRYHASVEIHNHNTPCKYAHAGFCGTCPKPSHKFTLLRGCYILCSVLFIIVLGGGRSVSNCFPNHGVEVRLSEIPLGSGLGRRLWVLWVLYHRFPW